MDIGLVESLARSIFRFKRFQMPFPPGLDIHMGELAIMGGIAKDGCFSPKNINVPEIQHHLHITKPAISQMLNSLEKKGYLSREIDKHDRRKIVVALTPKGRQILKTNKEFMDGLLGEIITRFGEEETKQLIASFNRFSDILVEVSEEIQLENKKGDESN